MSKYNRFIETTEGKKDKEKEEDWLEFHKKYIEGIETSQEIADLLGIDRYTIIKIFKKLGFKTLSRKEATIFSRRRVKETFLRKYGTDWHTKTESNKEKVKNTCMEKHGVSNVSKLAEVKEKVKNTCMEKHGVSNIFKDVEKIKTAYINKLGADNPNKVKEIRDKIDATCRKRYGVKSYTQTEEYSEKVKNTCINKYNVPNVMNFNVFKEKCFEGIKHSTFNRWNRRVLKPNNYSLLDNYEGVFLLDEQYKYISWKKYLFTHSCGEIFLGKFNRGGIRCPKCFPHNKSLPENLIKFYIEELGFNTIQGRRDICKGYELDIFIPELNIGFEYNGWYWHQEENVAEDYNFITLKPSGYHKNKTKKFKESGVDIFHLWENKERNNIEELKYEVKKIIQERINEFKK